MAQYRIIATRYIDTSGESTSLVRSSSIADIESWPSSEWLFSESVFTDVDRDEIWKKIDARFCSETDDTTRATIVEKLAEIIFDRDLTLSPDDILRTVSSGDSDSSETLFEHQKLYVSAWGKMVEADFSTVVRDIENQSPEIRLYDRQPDVSVSHPTYLAGRRKILGSAELAALCFVLAIASIVITLVKDAEDHALPGQKGQASPHYFLFHLMLQAVTQLLDTVLTPTRVCQGGLLGPVSAKEVMGTICRAGVSPFGAAAAELGMAGIHQLQTRTGIQVPPLVKAGIVAGLHAAGSVAFKDDGWYFSPVVDRLNTQYGRLIRYCSGV